MQKKSPLQHISFILDGNRRYATEHNISKFEGHKRGYNNLKIIAKSAILEHHIPYVSVYAFSTQNWNRTQEEVSYLMDLLLYTCTKDLKEFSQNNIRIRFLGSRTRLSDKILKAIDNAEEKTKQNTVGTLGLCINYSGQIELVEAFQKMLENDIQKKDVTPEKIKNYLYAPEMPPIDLMIRTSGEQRISNYQLWRLAYAELFFIKKHWPAFTPQDLEKILEEYQHRNRRFGV